jgi:hypothetical protein
MTPPCYRALVRVAVLLAGFLLGATGCGEDATTPPDLSIGPPDQGDTLTLSVAGRTRPMVAWYSYYVEPLSDERPPGVYLVITAIEPGFDCAHPAPGFDSVSFLFRDRAANAYTTTVLARSGPDLSGTVGPGASAELDAVDDRLTGYDLDGGIVTAGAGSASGRIDYRDGTTILGGSFAASYCAALDFIVPG